MRRDNPAKIAKSVLQRGGARREMSGVEWENGSKEQVSTIKGAFAFRLSSCIFIHALAQFFSNTGRVV